MSAADEARALLEQIRTPESRAARRSCRAVDLGKVAVPILSQRRAVDLAQRLVSTAGEFGWLWRSDVLADDADIEQRRAKTALTEQLAHLIEAAGATVPPPEPEPPPPGRAAAALLQWEKADEAAGAAGGYEGPDAWHGRHESRLLRVGEIAARTAGIARRAAWLLLSNNEYEPSDLYDPSLLADDAAEDPLAEFLLAVSRQMTYWKKIIGRQKHLVYALVIANPKRAEEEGGGSTADKWGAWLELRPFQGAPDPIAVEISSAGWRVPAEPRPE